MRHIKIALTGLAIAGVATGGFLRWQSSTSRLESKALQLYLSGNSREAYEQLVSLEHQMPLPQLLLLQAYTLRDNDLIGRSNQRLSQAIEALQESGKKLSNSQRQLLLEIALNLALNGHLMHDRAIFEQGLKIAEQVEPRSPWIYAFHALQAEDARHFVEAGELADKASHRSFSSKWMQKTFSQIFGKNWDTLLHVRALIETGKTVAASELMSQIPAGKDTSKEELRLLSALINIKEGQSRPIDLSLGYFQLAYAKLKALSLQSKSAFASDYDEIATAFSKQGQAALKAGKLDNVDFYVGALSDWHDKEHLEPLAKSYIGWLAGEELSGKAMPDLSSDLRLNSLLHTPEWEQTLHQALIAKLDEALTNKRWDAVEQFWIFTVASSDSTPQLIAELTQAVESYIDQRFNALLIDMAAGDAKDKIDPVFRDLSQLLPLLAQMESKEGNYQQFLQRLVDQAGSLLQTATINPEATRVFMMLAQSTSAPNPEQLLAMIRDKITKRFNAARNTQDMATMSSLFDISSQIGAEAIPSYSKENLANMLADSRYLLESDQVNQAQNQLRWILKLDPSNTQAKVLLGSSFFVSGDYAEAAKWLSELKEPTNEVSQILAISLLRSGSGDKAMAIVKRLKSQGLSIGDRLLLESGLYLTGQKQWRMALEQFSSISKKAPDIWVYMMTCNYRLNDARGVWQSFNQLPQTMRANRQITALALRSIDSPQLWGIANNIMETAMNMPSDKTVITPGAKEFLDKNFSAFELDLSIAAASYLQSSKQDPGRALDLLSTISPAQNDWRLQCEKALALLQLDLPEEAYNELTALGELPLDQDHVAFWLIVAQAQRECAQYDACAQTLDRIEKTLGSMQAINHERALMYFDTLRLDLCLEQIKPWLTSSSLEMHMLYMDCLVKSARFEEALAQAQIVSQKDHSAWALWRITGILYPAWQALGKSWQLPTRNLFELLKPEEKALALQTMLKMGEFEHAQNWAQAFQEELQGNFEGKLVRMHLALIQNQMSEAQTIKQELLTLKNRSLDQSLRLISWLEILSDETSLHKLLSDLPDPLQFAALHNQSLVKIGQKQAPIPHMEAVLASCAAHLASMRVTLNKKGVSDERAIKRLELIRNFCQNARSDKGPLQFFWLAGEAELLMSEPFAAEQDLKLCIQTCPSFLQAYLRMSEVLATQKAWGVAIDLLQKAQVHDPKNAWLQLSIAKYQFEWGMMNKPRMDPSVQIAISPILESAQKNLDSCLASSPYLADAYILEGRIDMRSCKWKEAYENLMRAESLKPGDRDLLSLLAATIEERIRQEGSRVEWQEQLSEIRHNLNLLTTKANTI